MEAEFHVDWKLFIRLDGKAVEAGETLIVAEWIHWTRSISPRMEHLCI